MYNIITLYNLQAFTNNKNWKKSKMPMWKYSVCDSTKESPIHQVGRISRKKPLLDLTQPFRSYPFFLKHHHRAKEKDKFTLLSVFSFVPCFLFLRKECTFLKSESHSHQVKGNEPGNKIDSAFYKTRSCKISLASWGWAKETLEINEAEKQ